MAALTALITAALVSACGVTSPSPTVPTPVAPTTVVTPAVSPSTPRTLRVSLAGDFDSTPDTTKVLRRIGQVQPDANIMLGDLSYGVTGAERSWCGYASRLTGRTPNYLLAGNHESDGENGRIEAFVECLPAPSAISGKYSREYFIDLPAEQPMVRIVLISPGIDFGAGEVSYAPETEHYRWTERAITDARSAGIPWVVVGMHKVCYSAGRYSCEVGQELMAMLFEHRVDVIFSGHEHLYQRSAQLASGTEECKVVPTKRYLAPCVVDTGDRLQQGAGTVLVTVGTGGRALRDIKRADPEAAYYVALSGKNALPSHGFVLLTVTPNSLEASFDHASTGRFTDTFTVQRK